MNASRISLWMKRTKTNEGNSINGVNEIDEMFECRCFIWRRERNDAFNQLINHLFFSIWKEMFDWLRIDWGRRPSHVLLLLLFLHQLEKKAIPFNKQMKVCWIGVALFLSLYECCGLWAGGSSAAEDSPTNFTHFSWVGLLLCPSINNEREEEVGWLS